MKKRSLLIYLFLQSIMWYAPCDVYGATEQKSERSPSNEVKGTVKQKIEQPSSDNVNSSGKQTVNQSTADQASQKKESKKSFL